MLDMMEKLKKGWIFTNGNWQYADPTTGILVKYQWKKIDNQWYYFDYSMAKGYWTIEGELNKFTENGVWQGACGKNKWLQDPKQQNVGCMLRKMAL